MKLHEWLLLLAITTAYYCSTCCSACLLCYLRLPPRPRPIDHLWFSALEDVYLPDNFDEMCDASKHLPFSSECRDGIAHIFCSLADFFEMKWKSCESSTNDYEECANCIRNKTAIIWMNSWAITWLDSVGKMPPAVSEGNYYWLGDYEQCSVLRKYGLFDGRYCRVLLDIPNIALYHQCSRSETLEIHLGICAPSKCTPNEITQLAQSVTPYTVSVECELQQTWPLSSIIFTFLTLAWLILLAVGTIYDLLNEEANSKHQIITSLARCMSIRSNGNLALSTKRDHDYHAVQGLQVITLSLIITGNCFIYITPYIENVLFSYESVYKWQIHPFNNFTYHIDSLIAMSALFTALILRPIMKTANDIKRLYFDRLLQVVPTFALLLLFVTFIFERLSSGPIWMHNDLIARCKSSWWKNLLFINNFFPARETCLDGAYLYSLEAQFFVILLPALYISKNNRTAVFAVAVSSLFASLAYIFFEVSKNKLPPTLLLTAKSINTTDYEVYINKLYTKPWSRAPAFIIGFLFSFLFTEDIRINKVVLRIFNFVLFLLSIFIMFALYPYAITNLNDYSPTFLCLYATLHRAAWTAIICSLIYMGYQNNGHNGIFSQFLEWRIFSPLAKHTFLVFLISEPVSLYLFTSLHRPLHATLWTLLNITIGTIILSYLLAFMLDISVSLPIVNIVNLFFDLAKKNCDENVICMKTAHDSGNKNVIEEEVLLDDDGQKRANYGQKNAK